MDFLSLPDDIHGLIVQRLDVKSACFLSSTCTKMYKRVPRHVRSFRHLNAQRADYTSFLSRCVNVEELIIRGILPSPESLDPLTRVTRVDFYREKDLPYPTKGHHGSYSVDLAHLRPWIMGSPIETLNINASYLSQYMCRKIASKTSLRSLSEFRATCLDSCTDSLTRLTVGEFVWSLPDDINIHLARLTNLEHLSLAFECPRHLYKVIGSLPRLQSLDLCVSLIDEDLVRLPLRSLDILLRGPLNLTLLNRLDRLEWLEIKYVKPVQLKVLIDHPSRNTLQCSVSLHPDGKQYKGTLMCVCTQVMADYPNAT